MSDEVNELHNSPPPPLPPRSSRNSDDLSPTSFKLLSVECNGDSNMSGHAIIETKHPKQEPDVQSDETEESSNIEAGEIDEKHPLSQEVSSKSHVPSSTSERYVCLYCFSLHHVMLLIYISILSNSPGK